MAKRRRNRQKIQQSGRNPNTYTFAHGNAPLSHSTSTLNLATKVSDTIEPHSKDRNACHNSQDKTSATNIIIDTNKSFALSSTILNSTSTVEVNPDVVTITKVSDPIYQQNTNAVLYMGEVIKVPEVQIVDMFEDNQEKIPATNTSTDTNKSSALSSTILKSTSTVEANPAITITQVSNPISQGNDDDVLFIENVIKVPEIQVIDTVQNNQEKIPAADTDNTLTISPSIIPLNSASTAQDKPDDIPPIQDSNPSTDEVNDDNVLYLYSVSKGQLVEVVDLDKNNQDCSFASPKRDFVLLPTTKDTQETSMHDDLDGAVSPSTQEKEAESRKRKRLEGAVSPSTQEKEAGSKKRKRFDGEAQCSRCNQNHEFIIKSGNELFISKCGHIFCLPCLKTLVPYNCTECKEAISSLFKIFL